MSDEVIEIPQFGTKHSLNISFSLKVFANEKDKESLVYDNLEKGIKDGTHEKSVKNKSKNV